MSVNPSAFGAVGDGVTNDRAALQAALNSVAAKGGTVQLEDDKVYLVDGRSLEIPRGVTLKGAVSWNGIRGNNGAQDFNTQVGIKLHPGHSIWMKGGSCIDGVLIRNSTLTFPQSNDLNWTGTAIKIVGEDDASVQNSMIIGFEQGVYAEGSQRVRCQRVNLDNINGIKIKTAWDICYIDECHAWPFATIGTGDIRRRGIAFMFEAGGDWNKITDSFSYGYVRGVWIKDCNSVTLLGVGCDNVPNEPSRDAIGILVEGNCQDTRLIGCQVAASQRGVVLAVTAGATMISELAAWANSQIGLQILGNPPVNLVNSIIRNTPTRISNSGGAPLNQVAVL